MRCQRRHIVKGYTNETEMSFSGAAAFYKSAVYDYNLINL